VGVDDCGNVATNYITVTVLPGQNCNPTNCISIYASNVVAYTCSNCTSVPYPVFAVDNCCAGAPPTLVFNPPGTYCFPLGLTTTVAVTAYDQCGNTASNSFTVTVLPAAGCAPPNCISIYSSNIVAYTCSNCTTVPFTATAFDSCCTNMFLQYFPPTNTCFLVNSTNPVMIVAYDSCNNAVTNIITVTVLPGPNCGGSGPGFTIARLPSAGTNLTISWPGTNAQLQQSSDLTHWYTIPGATNSPYLVPNSLPMNFYRLRYN